MHAAQHLCSNRKAGQETAHKTHVGKIDTEITHLGNTQAIKRQAQGFKVSFQPLMAVNFSTKLQWLARGMRTIRAGMQHRPAVAQAGHCLTIEQMRINAGNLLRGVRTQTEGTA